MKKYLLAFFYVFSFISLSTAMDESRPWPSMVYSDNQGKKYQLVSLREVAEKPFVKFTTTLFSTPGVYELYENGKPYEEERAQRLWNRVSPRTDEWFKGINTFVPWTVIRELETQNLIGILGAHLHTNAAANEYKGLEICYALDPNYRKRSILSNGFKVFAQTFAPQLYNLEDKFDRVLAPISPINFPSLIFVLAQGFKIGETGTPDQPYVSSYFPNIINNEETPKYLGYAKAIINKLKETPEMVEPNQDSFEPPIDEQNWEKLKALRVVVTMPKEDYLKNFLIKSGD